MDTFLFTNNKDIDFLILSYVEDGSLWKMNILNKYSNYACHDNKLWYLKLKRLVPYIPDSVIGTCSEYCHIYYIIHFGIDDYFRYALYVSGKKEVKYFIEFLKSKIYMHYFFHEQYLPRFEYDSYHKYTQNIKLFVDATDISHWEYTHYKKIFNKKCHDNKLLYKLCRELPKKYN